MEKSICMHLCVFFLVIGPKTKGGLLAEVLETTAFESISLTS